MILQELTIRNYRSFIGEVHLKIDPEVTVLTGANDVGKTAILDLIQGICERRPIVEDDANLQRTFSATTSWENDPDINCSAILRLTGYSFKNVEGGSGGAPNDILDVLFRLFEPQSHVISLLRENRNHQMPHIKIMPHIIRLPSEHEIGSGIAASTQDELEKHFLEMAFGSIGATKIKDRSEIHKSHFIEEANDRLNGQLQELVPYDIGLRLTFTQIPAEDLRFAVGLVDSHGGRTPVHLRGAGVRKIITLMAELSRATIENNHVYILFDEPENSLHADFQHKLRTFLEALAQRENIQVIYATHSPSMINSLNPRGVRLLERKNVNEMATTVINNEPPTTNNYTLVRTSLGMSPADSLLYAPITLIVEGNTEARCLPKLLKRLGDETIEGFDRVHLLLSNMHVIDSGGSQFHYWCKMARSQGSKPVLFLDGEKRKHHKQIENSCEGVPVTYLDEGKEFEDIVPVEQYFAALQEISGDENLTYENYEIWEKTANLSAKMLISKRINRWLEENTTGLDKPAAMEKALELTDLNDIQQLDKFLDLVQKMRSLL